MNKWAIVAIPLVLCVVLMEAVVRQFVADRSFVRAKRHIDKYETDCALHLIGKGPRPSPINFLGRHLTRAVKLEPHSGEYRNCLGRYYQALAADTSVSQQQRTELAKKAIGQYEKAVKLDPLNGVFLARLAWMQGVTGQHDKAVENFEQAVTLNRTNEWIQEVYDAYREWITSGEDTP